MREWVIYALIMSAIFFVLFRDGNLIGAIAGILVSGPLYLALGFVLAKFGYQRKSWTELRNQSEERDAGKRGGRRGDRDGTDEVAGPRPKPAPTKRTGGGSSRPGGPRKRR